MGLASTSRNESQAVTPAEAGPKSRRNWIPALRQAQGKLFAGMTRLSAELPWACGPPNLMKIPILVAPAEAGAHVTWIPAFR